MNHGLSEKLQIAFLSAVPVVRPIVEKSAGENIYPSPPPLKGGGTWDHPPPPERGGPILVD